MLAAAHSVAWAQEASTSTNTESDGPKHRNPERVVVTAQKREQPPEEVPFGLDVLRMPELDLISAAGEDILFLSARTPSLYAESSSGRIFPRFYIRGLGNTDFDLNANQPVSLVYDGIVLENPILKGFPVFDLERVEVLRGPQGTLFGRNTPAGIVKFESRRPTPYNEAYLRASYGRFNTIDTEGAISGPISDTLSVRLSSQFQSRDDFVDNTFDGGGEEGFEEFLDYAGRIQFLLEPTPKFSALLNVHGRWLDGGSRLFRANILRPGGEGLVDDFRRDRTAQDATQILRMYNIGSHLTLEGELGKVHVTSITGYERVGLTARGDVDGGFGADFAPPAGPGSIPFAAETADNIDDHHQVTSELRFDFDPVPEILHTTFGAFFFFEDLDIENLSFDSLSGGIQNGRATQNQNTLAWAVFTSNTLVLFERLHLTVGFRLSGENKDFVAERTQTPFGGDPLPPSGQDLDLDDVVPTGDFAALYELTDEVNVYARWARSFRAPNVQGRVVFGDAITRARTEIIDSVEGGLKTIWLDGRLTADATGYFYITQDQQLTAVGGAGNFNQLLNADQVLGYGAELQGRMEPVDRLEFSFGVSYNETQIQDPNLEVTTCAAPCTVLDPVDTDTGNASIDGNRLPQAPQVIWQAVLGYAMPVFGNSGEIFGVTDWAYRSQINFFLYESEEFQDNGLLEGGVRLGYRAAGGQFEASAFGRNILNWTAVEGAIDFNNLSGFVNDPAVWGLEVVGRF